MDTIPVCNLTTKCIWKLTYKNKIDALLKIKIAKICELRGKADFHVGFKFKYNNGKQAILWEHS